MYITNVTQEIGLNQDLQTDEKESMKKIQKELENDLE